MVNKCSFTTLKPLAAQEATSSSTEHGLATMPSSRSSSPCAVEQSSTVMPWLSISQEARTSLELLGAGSPTMLSKNDYRGKQVS
ncbi:uncharacterized protein LOC119161518 [Rhipicephalus microplus]|uniref:uncharacterized protein LOC119161518 n=1 Tax=Rhipicephalus microplus TaxID=6941 RepID=UPI003F6B9D56